MKNEKNLILWIDKPSIVTPITIVNDNPIDTIIEDVIVYEYGTLPIKLAIKIKINVEYIKGKYISFPNCSLTIEFILAKRLSNIRDHFEGNNFILLFARICKFIIKNNIKHEYKAKLVKVKFI